MVEEGRGGGERVSQSNQRTFSRTARATIKPHIGFVSACGLVLERSVTKNNTCI